MVSPKPTPQAAEKKKGNNGKKVGQVKVVGAGLEDFVDWANLVPPLEEAQGGPSYSLDYKRAS